jgi:ribosomal protein S18 acetylase RimI-like enzyme
MTNIIIASTQEHYKLTAGLFMEYAESLGFELCFQGFDKELASLPGKYASPDGCILLAYENDFPAGCIALRKYQDDICEMKRLYVKPEFRKHGTGKKLAEMIIEIAREKGYTKMILDTICIMKPAINLYQQLGFYKTNPYYHNPIEGACFFEKIL